MVGCIIVVKRSIPPSMWEDCHFLPVAVCLAVASVGRVRVPAQLIMGLAVEGLWVMNVSGHDDDDDD